MTVAAVCQNYYLTPEQVGRMTLYEMGYYCVDLRDKGEANEGGWCLEFVFALHQALAKLTPEQQLELALRLG